MARHPLCRALPTRALVNGETIGSVTETSPGPWRCTGQRGGQSVSDRAVQRHGRHFHAIQLHHRLCQWCHMNPLGTPKAAHGQYHGGEQDLRCDDDGDDHEPHADRRDWRGHGELQRRHGHLRHQERGHGQDGDGHGPGPHWHRTRATTRSTPRRRPRPTSRNWRALPGRAASPATGRRPRTGPAAHCRMAATCSQSPSPAARR